MRRAFCWISLALIALPAAAQSTRARLDDLDLRVGQLEETIRGQALVELSQRLDALAAESRGLRGDLDVLQQENETLRREQRDLAADFDRRLAALEARLAAVAKAPEAAEGATREGELATANAGAAASEASVSGVAASSASSTASTVSPPTVPSTAASTESAEVVYGRAFDSLKAARYPEAIGGMSDFLTRFPSHPLADNAQYWIGQAYYVTRDYAKALDAFAAVVGKSPDSSKAPDALLKKGLAESELGRTEAARATLNEVMRRYPQNDASRLAREQLARLR